MSKYNFVTAVNCIDGRVQLPLINWIKENYDTDFVDMITEPGPDKVLSTSEDKKIEPIKSKILISHKAHGSGLIFVAGHHDCAANPVSGEEHVNQVKSSVLLINHGNFPRK